MRTFTPLDVWTWSPSEIEALIGVSPDRIRDWRRRGFLDGFGVCRITKGVWTGDAHDPRLSGSERWVYCIEDVIALYVSKYIADLGVNLKSSFRLGLRSGELVIRWMREIESPQEETPARYLLTYPSINTADPQDPHIPIYGAENIEMVEFIGRPATLLIDCKAMAMSLPAAVREGLEK